MAGNGVVAAVALRETAAVPAVSGAVPPAGAAPAAVAAPEVAPSAPGPAVVRRGPHADPKFAALKKDVHAKQRTVAASHPPAKVEAGAAQAAARPPADDKEAQGKTANAEKMDAAQPKDFDKAAFVKAVEEAIAKRAPQNLEQADEFGDSGKAEEVKGEVQGKVSEGKQASEKEIATTTAAPPDTSKAVDKQVVPLTPDKPPPVPGTPDPANAVPDKLPPSATDMSAGPRQVDHEMADAQVTEPQLAKSNEPTFTAALGHKQAAERHSAQAPGQLRAGEQQTLNAAKADAKQLGTGTMQAIGGQRVATGHDVGGGKTRAKSTDEAKRAQVTATLQRVFDATKKDVEDILSGLDRKVDDQFGQGERAARETFTRTHKRDMQEYKDRRYGGWDGWTRWLHDKVFELPDEVKRIYERARDGYLADMRQLIVNIADTVAEELGRAKNRIAKGRADLKAEVERLPADLRAIGREAATEFADKFDELSDSLQEKATELVDTLADKYTEALKSVDEEIAAEKEKNKGLVAKAKDAIKGVIDTIKELKDLLLGVLRKAKQAIGAILKDPIGFLRNLVSAVGAGLKQFMRNIGKHLMQGLVAWLLGISARAGLQIPTKFDVKGIVLLIAGLLGLTWTSIRARIVRKRVPEPAITAAETALPLVSKARREGVGGLWDDMKAQIGDLRKELFSKLISYLVPTIIIAGITWVISLLNPASAFVRACKLIIDIVKFIVQRARQIVDFVNAVLDAVIAIAKGGTGGVAGLIENALAKSIPVLIGFLAALLGIGGIADKVRKIFQELSKPVNKAVDWVIDKIVGLVKRLWNKIKPKPKKPRRPKPEKPDTDKPRKPRRPRRDRRDSPRRSQAPGEPRKPRKDQRDAPAKGAVAAALRDAVALVRPAATVEGIERGLEPIRRRHRIKRLSLIIERFGPTSTTLRFAGANSPEDKSGPVNLWHKTYDGIRHLVELTKGIPQLVVSRRRLEGGSSLVQVLTFRTGETVVRKVPPDDTELMRMVGSSERRNLRTVDEYADAERLGSLVGRAIGAPVPAAFRYSETELLMDYVDGTAGRTFLVLDPAQRRFRETPEIERLRDTPEGRRLGLLDVLIGNRDRNVDNWVVVDGKVVGIDQGDAWSEAGKNLSDWRNKGFARAYYDFENGRWLQNDLSRDDIEKLERALKALRPEFVPSRQDWYDDMMRRFAEVKKHSRWHA